MQAQRIRVFVASCHGTRVAVFGLLAGALWSDPHEQSLLGGMHDRPRWGWCFGTGVHRVVAHDVDGRFGTRSGCVFDDVGVCFGRSERHRIEISSSHTRHPARKGRTPGLPGQGNRRFLSSFVRSVLPGTRLLDLSGG